MFEHTNNPKVLRISAQKVHDIVFSEMRLQDLIYWLGYRASGQCTSELKMAKALESYCIAQHPTIRRWINGQAKPNGTNMLMIYGGVMAAYYDGNQTDMFYDFVKFTHPDKLAVFFG